MFLKVKVSKRLNVYLSSLPRSAGLKLAMYSKF